MPNAPVIFVTGPIGHGKTTAREIISRVTHMKGGSCSDVIYAILANRRQVSVESLKQIPKEELRPALIEVGDFVCGSVGEIKEAPVNNIDESLYRHPSALIRTLYLNGYNVIDGVRRRLELQHAQQHLDWNGVRSVVIHVQDPRKPIVQDNSEDLRDLADNQIVNDGTVGDLEIKILAVLEQHFPNALPKTPDAPAAEPAQETPAA
jgi:hypothetical protein